MRTCRERETFLTPKPFGRHTRDSAKGAATRPSKSAPPSSANHTLVPPNTQRASHTIPCIFVVRINNLYVQYKDILATDSLTEFVAIPKMSRLYCMDSNPRSRNPRRRGDGTPSGCIGSSAVRRDTHCPLRRGLRRLDVPHGPLSLFITLQPRVG